MQNNNKVKLFALISIIFFSVSGGPYGLEEIVSSIGGINTLLLILLLPILWTIPETMIVAELASNYPVQGGYYRWVQMGLGRFWGFMEGWWSILYTLIDLSIYPILFTTYLKIIFPTLCFSSVYLIQLIMIWSSAIVNILGIKTVTNFLTVFQFIILISFGFFIFEGLNYISFDFTPILKPHIGFSSNNLLFGLSLAFWNFIGWDNGSTVLHEVDNPKVNYHKALFLTIPIIVFFYFFPVLVGLCIHPDYSSWSFGEFSFIASSINQPILALILTIGGMITCLGLFNSLLLSSSRIFLTMSEDRMLPLVFSKLHNKYKTPHIAIIFVAFVYSVLVLVSFQKLIIYDVFMYLAAIFLEAIALLILRKKHLNKPGNFKIPFGNFGLVVFVGTACFIVIAMLLINIINLNGYLYGSFFSIFLLLSGLPFYLIYKNKAIVS